MRQNYLLIIAIMLLTSVTALSQDKKMIGFKPIVNSIYAPDNVIAYIENRVTEIMTNEGIAHTSGNFILDVNINEISKVVTPTNPSRTQIKMEVSFRTIDKTQGTVLNSMTLTASGLDNSAAAAYMKAAESLNIRSRNFLNFIKVSRDRLYEYYESGYATMPKEDVPQVEVEEEVRNEDDNSNNNSDNNQSESIELFDGVYVEYLNYEHKSSTTDLIFKFTNTNDDDKVISFNGRNQLMVDSTGKNISNSGESYYDNSYISGGSITLIEDIPVTIRISYRGKYIPKVVYIHERNSDVKVKIKCK